MNTLWDKNNQRDVIANYLDILQRSIAECRKIEEEILDGIEKVPTDKDSMLIKDIISVKDSLLKAYGDIQEVYERGYKNN